MPETLPCAICRERVSLDEDHRRVTDEKRRMRDRDEQDDYVLHDRCATAVLDGWRTP